MPYITDRLLVDILTVAVSGIMPPVQEFAVLWLAVR
jgi:hypothetical protein